MKFILLIRNNAAAIEGFAGEQRDAFFAEVGEVMEELTASGELVGGQALIDASQAKIVRVRDGVPTTTDGPYAEAKEQLAGYLIVDCENEQRAVEIAARWPDAQYWSMEVRQIMHTSGEEM